MSRPPTKTPHKLGAWAAKEGKNSKQNPFRSGTYKHKEWFRGLKDYHHAKRIEESGINALLIRMGYPQGHAGILRVLEDGVKNPKRGG